MFNVTLLYTNIDMENLPFVDPFPLSPMVFPQKKNDDFLEFPLPNLLLLRHPSSPNCRAQRSAASCAARPRRTLGSSSASSSGRVGPPEPGSSGVFIGPWVLVVDDPLY